MPGKTIKQMRTMNIRFAKEEVIAADFLKAEGGYGRSLSAMNYKPVVFKPIYCSRVFHFIPNF